MSSLRKPKLSPGPAIPHRLIGRNKGGKRKGKQTFNILWVADTHSQKNI